jgi:hypothetical protein
MDENPNPKNSSATTTLIWLTVGLAPILVLLIAVSGNGPSQVLGRVLFIFCVICNLLGGFGCARNVKDGLSRVLLGVFLSVCFFVVSVIVALLEACSHMQF